MFIFYIVRKHEKFHWNARKHKSLLLLKIAVVLHLMSPDVLYYQVKYMYKQQVDLCFP